MAYREQELMPVCADCNEFATGHCARCERPLCDFHDTREDMRCVECETEFMRRVAATKFKTSVPALLITVVCGLIMLGAAPTFFRNPNYPAILNVFLVLPFGAWGLRALLPVKTRRSFLKEKLPPKALGPGESPKLLGAAGDVHDEGDEG